MTAMPDGLGSRVTCPIGHHSLQRLADGSYKCESCVKYNDAHDGLYAPDELRDAAAAVQRRQARIEAQRSRLQSE